MYKGDEINLLYVLREHGWSDIVFFVNGETHHIRVTHVFSDPVADLAQLAMKVHNRREAFELLLWDEPGGHLVRLERLKDQHHKYVFRLYWFPEGPPEPTSRTETLVSEFEVKGEHLVKLIRGELEKTAALLEEKSYREHRDFPIREFKHLKSELSS